MTGSEKIVAQILDEARQAGEQMLREAEEQAARIRAEAEEQAAAKQAELAAQALARAEETGRAARSAAQLIRRNRLLEERRALLRETLEQIAVYLREMPADAYFRALESLIRTAAMPGEGILRLNDRDRARLPADFITRVNTGLSEGRQVVLASEAADIDGGFLLQYGDIEMNGSLSAMLDTRREELEDFISHRLFS